MNSFLDGVVSAEMKFLTPRVPENRTQEAAITIPMPRIGRFAVH
jgi:hypothetical protein